MTVTGEGGSGGALALGIGDRILMLEHSIYSVISPEGCAAILWKDAARKKEAAEALKLTASDLKELRVIDEIVPEPPGGAHADPAGAAAAVGEAVERNLREIADLTPEERRERRYRRFRALGQFEAAIEAGPHLSGARRKLEPWASGVSSPGSAEQDEALARAAGVPRVVAAPAAASRRRDGASRRATYLRPADGRAPRPLAPGGRGRGGRPARRHGAAGAGASSSSATTTSTA